mgnify:FL=1|jgi:NADH-quinone oxidoreductase subunit H
MFGPGESATIIECSANATCTTVHAIFTSVLLFFLLLTGFAYMTLLERRLIAWFQARVGPNRAGPQGLLQPVADGIKLIFKEDITPRGAEKAIFWLAPLIKMVPTIIVVAVVPLGPPIAIPWFDGNWYRVTQGLTDLNIGVLWILGITSIGIYGIVLAGWASNNKYAILGGLRSSAQMISYELSLGLAVVVPVLLTGSMSVGDIIEAQNDPPILGWYVFQNPLAAAILFIALLAEVNRAPFDLPEAEQELTAGYHSEYSGMKFALFYLAEYIGMITVSMVASAFYLGGYHFVFVDRLPLLGPLVYAAKVILLLMGMVWVRATLPRIRYDRLMHFGWKIMLPLAMAAVAWSAIAVFLAEQFGDALTAVFSIAALVLFLGGAQWFLTRAGRGVIDAAPAEVSTVETVSLSSQARSGR